MNGIWGFFLENMRKTIREREEEDFFWRGELEDRGRRLREKKKGKEKREFWKNFGGFFIF